jgi:hypothetical protein
MRTLRIATTIALLLFVGVTVGMLIAQEVAYLAHETDEEPVSPAVQANDPVDPPADTSRTEMPVPNEDTEAVTSGTEDEGNEITAADDGSVAGPDGDEVDLPDDTVMASEPCRVTATYFHTTFRCRTCRQIEERARTVVMDDLGNEVRAGRLAWRAINMQREREFIAQFELDRPTLILTRAVGEEIVEWTALHDTWTLLASRVGFASYVREHVEEYLERCP